ncbi:ovochymase-2 [Pteropus vampyrus]|uniref:Ovochymase-2 n=1 Tax=Pteropus vampyrus TaxID=132908 RepID=A0A6P6C0I7_PTEVA|nr:ovochymase-2 [Pteropus vampyrus]
MRSILNGINKGINKGYKEEDQMPYLEDKKAPTCGQSLVKARPWNYFHIFSRIVGGSQVEKGSYPWQVSLKRRQKHICGGTIISPQWVITAAHCVANRNIASTLNVTAGKHDLSRMEPGEQTLTIESIIIHPHFSRKKPMDYDIALLKMAGTFHFGQDVGPMCLPEPGERFKAGLICKTAGWGRLTEGKNFCASTLNQLLELPILTRKECVAALLTLKKPVSGQTFLCTGFPDGGRDACQGDSGGSLMCQNKKGAWTLAGVTSWGLGCGRGWRNNVQKDDQGSPGIFTDLSKVLPWIHKHIQTGNKSKTSKIWSSCSEQDPVISEPEGELHFPESPYLYYDSKQLCVWTLLVSEEMHVLLIFSQLDAESCHHNYLSIYSLEDRLIGEWICTQFVPIIHLRCNVESSQLSFQNMEIEESGDCTCDYVTVHRDVERKKEIARLCGFVAPEPVLSFSGIMLISFQSDENVTFKGFQATVSFIPETDLNISRSEDESVFLDTWNVLPEEPNASGEMWMQRETRTKGEHHMNMKAETGVMHHLQDKERQSLPANHQKLGERHETNSPSQP